MNRRPCYAPELRALSEARAFADLADQAEGVKCYRLFRERAARLIAALIRVPHLQDAMTVIADGTIPAADYSADSILNWDALTDDRAALLANVLRAIGFAKFTVQQLALAIEADRLTVADAVEQLHACGLVYPNARHEICLSPLGQPAAVYLEAHNDAIRPPHSARLANRRKH